MRVSVTGLVVLVIFSLITSPTQITAQDQEAEPDATYGEFLFFDQADPIDDSDQSFVATRQDDGALMVRCDGPNSFQVLVAGDYFGDDPSVTYRFDDEEPVEKAGWSGSTNGQGAFAPDDREPSFVEEMKNAEQLAVRVWGYDNERSTYVIDLTGATDALSQMACIPE